MIFAFRSGKVLHASHDANPAFVFDGYPPPPAPVAPVEIWPAAGGGLLAGIAEPSLGGSAPRRASVKTIFLRIETSGRIHLLLPYVRLDPEARRCARALVAQKLAVSEGTIMLDDAGTDERCPVIVDLGPTAERSLQSCGAAASELLRRAAAELWQTDIDDCMTAHGCVRAPGHAAAYGDLAADAALHELSSADTKAWPMPMFR